MAYRDAFFLFRQAFVQLVLSDDDAVSAESAQPRCRRSARSSPHPSIFLNPFRHNFGAKLEFNTFASGGGEGRGSTADYFWQLLLGAAALLPMAAWLGIHVLGPSLLAFVIYLWSRRNPEEQATFWFFRVPGALLPWIMVGFTFLLGDDPVPDLLGIAAAHAYYYIVDVLPRTPGPFANTRSWLQTPERVVFAFGAMPTGLGARQPGAARGPNPPPQHRWGGGRRLAD
jgi:hypothetical protein